MENLQNELERALERLKDTAYGVQLAAIQMLGKLKDAKAVAALIEALDHSNKGDYKNRVERAIGDALAEIGDPAILPLIEALNDEKRSDRFWIAVALSNVRRKEEHIIIALFNYLYDPQILGLRYGARQALGVIIASNRLPKISPLIEAKLKEKDAATQLFLIKMLGEGGGSTAIPILKMMEKVGNTENVRKLASEAIKDIKAGVTGKKWIESHQFDVEPNPIRNKYKWSLTD